MSKVDEMFYKKTFEKIERYKENELIEARFETHFLYKENTKIVFDNGSKNIEMLGTIDLETLQAINEKVKELGWNE